jgi:hypothetical protein
MECHRGQLHFYIFCETLSVQTSLGLREHLKGLIAYTNLLVTTIGVNSFDAMRPPDLGNRMQS